MYYHSQTRWISDKKAAKLAQAYKVPHLLRLGKIVVLQFNIILVIHVPIIHKDFVKNETNCLLSVQ